MKNAPSQTNREIEVTKIKTDKPVQAILLSSKNKKLILEFDDFSNDGLLRKKYQNFVGGVVDQKELSWIKQKAIIAPQERVFRGVSRAGYSNFDSEPPLYFALPNGKIISSEFGTEKYISMFERDYSSSVAGTLEKFNTGVSRAIKNQPIPILFFFMALSPVLQPFTRAINLFVENFILELVGPTGSNKSTLTTLMAGAIWGGGRTKLGYAKSWNSTVNSAEAICSDYNNCLLTLDEATALADNERDRADARLHFVHRLSLGTPKSRLNELEGEPFSLVVFSNSNEHLLTNIRGSERVGDAAAVRVLSFDCADPRHGYLLPSPSCERPGDELRDAVNNNFGHIAPAFIKAILRRANEDFSKFKNELSNQMETFLKKANVDRKNETAMRIAKPFALAYACAYFAISEKIVRVNEFGKILRQIRLAFTIFLSQSKPTTVEYAITAFLNEQGMNLFYCKDSLTEMSDIEFKSYDGFLFQVKGKKCLGLTTEKFKEHFSEFPWFRSKLKDKNLLIASEGDQFKKRIRMKDGSPKNERFYVIDISKREYNAAFENMRK